MLSRKWRRWCAASKMDELVQPTTPAFKEKWRSLKNIVTTVVWCSILCSWTENYIEWISQIPKRGTGRKEFRWCSRPSCGPPGGWMKWNLPYHWWRKLWLWYGSQKKGGQRQLSRQWLIFKFSLAGARQQRKRL